MMARGETSLPQLGQVGAPEEAASGAATGTGGGGAAVRKAGACAIAGAGAPTGVGTVILDWHVGQGISSPA